jgi:hypothetical protein
VNVAPCSRRAVLAQMRVRPAGEVRRHGGMSVVIVDEAGELSCGGPTAVARDEHLFGRLDVEAHPGPLTDESERRNDAGDYRLWYARAP